jgi:thioredoxin-related protein
MMSLKSSIDEDGETGATIPLTHKAVLFIILIWFSQHYLPWRRSMRCTLLSCLCLAIILSATPLLGQEMSGMTSIKYVEITKYDPTRNAEEDFADALSEAKRTGKHVLLSVGDDGCEWCRTLDNFYVQNPQILDFRARNYVHVKIAYSSMQRSQVLARLPQVLATPHFFVLESSGILLHSQDTDQLELRNSYDSAKFFAFLKKWAPTSKKKK